MTPKFHEIFKTPKKRIIEEKPKERIIVDYREKNSLVPTQLRKKGFEIEFQQLKVADYIVKNVAIERKTVQDFISSMINKRLINQLLELQQYEKKLLIIEGTSEQELYDEESDFGVNPNAIRGFLLSIVLSFRVPIIFTKDAKDTAAFIEIISKKKSKELSLNVSKKTLDKNEQLQFIIESFPGIGPKTAKKILQKFGTIQNIINAPEESLKELIGKKSETMIEIINRKYTKKINPSEQAHKN